jgi:hypothetical protein
MLVQPFVNLNLLTGRMFLSPSVIGAVYHTHSHPATATIAARVFQLKSVRF